MSKQDNTPIEARHLKGVTLKGLVTLMISTIAIVTTIITTTGDIKDELKAAAVKNVEQDKRLDKKDEEDKQRDMFYQTTQLQIKTLELRLDNLERIQKK